jgi:hypothetical protein
VPRTDLEWLCARLEALYESDGQGRLVRRRPPDARPAPRFVFGRTQLGCIWRFAAGEPERAVCALARYAALEPPVGGLGDGRPAAPERLEPMRRALEAEAPLDRVWSGALYRFHADRPGRRHALESIATGSGVLIDPSDPRLAACAAALAIDEDTLRGQLPLATSSHDDRVVSVCRCGRGTATGFVHARVDTLASARGHGHAARSVAAWALAVADLGGSPLYASAWTNRASHRVARKLGLLAFAEVWTFT